MGSSGWSPGLWQGSNRPGYSGFVRLHGTSPCYFRNSNDKLCHKCDQGEEIDALATPWVNAQLAHLLLVWRAAAMVEDGQTTGNSNLSGYNKIVLTKTTKTINAFSSHVIIAKAGIAHISERIDVMTQVLHIEDGSLPQGLMVQNAYTELRKGSKNVIVVVRNSTAYPQTLRKKTPVVRAVVVTWVLEPLYRLAWQGHWGRTTAIKHPS